LTADRGDKKMITEACYAMGIGTPYFYDNIVGIAFNPEGTPVLLALTWRKIPLKVREKMSGRKIKMVEFNRSSEWVTVY
jgi:hypothetical protein